MRIHSLGHLALIGMILVAVVRLDSLSAHADENPIRDFLDGLDQLTLIETEPRTLAPLPEPRPGLTGNLALSGKIVNRETELSILRSYGDVIWPGALIQGKSITNNKFAGINLDRSGGNISITSELVLGDGAAKKPKFDAKIETMSLSAVNGARKRLLHELDAKDSAGVLTYDLVSAGTLAEAYVKLGVAYDAEASELEAEAEASAKHFEKTFYLKFTQTFYKVTFSPSDNKHPFIAPTESLGNVKRFCSKNNPPLYISEVIYGRMLIMSFTTHKTEAELMSTFKASYQSGSGSVSGNATAKARAELSSMRVRVLSTGATGEAAGKLVNLTGDELIEKVGEYIDEGAKFNSRTNPGVPIGIVMRYVGSGAPNKIVAAQMLADASPEVVNTKAVAHQYPVIEVWDGKDGGVVDTGIDVFPGDKLSITATGKNWSGVFATGEYGPDGWNTWDEPAGGGRGYPVSNHHPFSLVARLGATADYGHCALGLGYKNNPTKRGNWFYVGKGREIKNIGGRADEGGIPYYGRLYLTTNDDNPENGDAKLKFTVTVKVTPRDPAK